MSASRSRSRALARSSWCAIAHARTAAREAGLTENVAFEIADARSFPGGGYDAVQFIDSLPDMGDPVAAAMHAPSTLRPGGGSSGAQHGPHAFGAMAGEAALRGVLLDAGFSQVERVAPDAPRNMVLVARG